MVRGAAVPRTASALKLDPAETTLKEVVGQRLGAHGVAVSAALGEMATATGRKAIGS